MQSNRSNVLSRAEIDAVAQAVRAIVDAYKLGAVTLGLSTQMLRHLLALVEAGDRDRLSTLVCQGVLPSYPFSVPATQGASARFQKVLLGHKAGSLSASDAWQDVRDLLITAAETAVAEDEASRRFRGFRDMRAA